MNTIKNIFFLQITIIEAINTNEKKTVRIVEKRDIVI